MYPSEGDTQIGARGHSSLYLASNVALHFRLIFCFFFFFFLFSDFFFGP
jgi:hypothetical protein